MPRKVFINNPENFYHITARCINKEWFISLDETWEIMVRFLYFIHHAFDIQIYNFVLMNNHFHLILRAPKNNLSQAMGYFMTWTSRNISKAGHRLNQTYGARFHRSEIKSLLYFSHAYKYVYLNPVKAGLSNRAEDYPFSTLNGLLGKSHLLVPLVCDHQLFDNAEEQLEWLNCMPSTEYWDSISLALRRKVFELPKVNRKLHPLSSRRF